MPFYLGEGGGGLQEGTHYSTQEMSKSYKLDLKTTRYLNFDESGTFFQSNLTSKFCLFKMTIIIYYFYRG